MGPAPGWITTPPGVLEMEVDWADPAHRFYTGTAVGEDFEGVQHFGFLRDMDNKTQETIVIRYPEQRLVFQARMLDGWSAKCDVRIVSIRQGTALWEAREGVSGFEPHANVLAVGSPPSAVPGVLYAAVEPLFAQDRAIAKGIGGRVLAPNSRLDAFELDPPKVHSLAWQATDAKLVQSSTLGAWNDQLYFTLSGNPASSEIWTWGPDSGAGALLPGTGLDAGQIGSTCGFGTDGTWMVWTQASGWNGTTWDSIDIMKAPYTTDPKAIQPTKVREAPGGNGRCLLWTVGGGYAGMYHRIGKGPAAKEHRVVLVRLSDGMMWEIPSRPQRNFGSPLYITQTEVVMEEGLTIPNDAGVTEFQSWSIVRYPISLLGPGTPP